MHTVTIQLVNLGSHWSPGTGFLRAPCHPLSRQNLGLTSVSRTPSVRRSFLSRAHVSTKFHLRLPFVTGALEEGHRRDVETGDRRKSCQYQKQPCFSVCVSLSLCLCHLHAIFSFCVQILIPCTSHWLFPMDPSPRFLYRLPLPT